MTTIQKDDVKTLGCYLAQASTDWSVSSVVETQIAGWHIRLFLRISRSRYGRRAAGRSIRMWGPPGAQYTPSQSTAPSYNCGDMTGDRLSGGTQKTRRGALLAHGVGRPQTDVELIVLGWSGGA
jgi:hypothetical protein